MRTERSEEHIPARVLGPLPVTVIKNAPQEPKTTRRLYEQSPRKHSSSRSETPRVTIDSRSCEDEATGQEEGCQSSDSETQVPVVSETSLKVLVLRRKVKSLSLSLPKSTKESESPLTASEDTIPAGVVSAGRGLRLKLPGHKEAQHHGPLSPRHQPVAGEMMTTKDLLKLIKRCRKSSTPAPIQPGQKGYQFNSPELRRYLEERRRALRELCEYGPLVMALETEDTVASALLAMLSGHLEARLSWPTTLEFPEVRLDTLGLVFRLVGRLGAARTAICNQRFIASGMHRIILQILPLMKLAELELVEPYLVEVFGLGGPIQYDLIAWIKETIGVEGSQKNELEAGKDWALFVLGQLIMTIRHPKRTTHPTPTMARVLGMQFLHDGLDQEWERLFLEALLPHFASRNLETLLHPLRLAYGALAQYSPLASTEELALHRLMAIAERLAPIVRQQEKPNVFVAHIDFLLGIYNYGALQEAHWARFFRILFALLPGQLGADAMINELLQEPGLIEEAVSTPERIPEWVMAILNGLVSWAEVRKEEGERWLAPGSLKKAHMALINEPLIVRTMARWTPVLELVMATKDNLKCLLQERWDMIKEATSLQLIPILPITHAYEGLPTLRSGATTTSLRRSMSRTRSEGYQLKDANQEESGQERATAPTPKKVRPRFHQDSLEASGSRPKLGTGDSQQDLIRQTRLATAKSTWNQFTSTQSEYVLERLEPVKETVEQAVLKDKRPSTRKIKSASTNDKISGNRSKTDLELSRRRKEEQKTENSDRPKRSKTTIDLDLSNVSGTMLETALQQLASFHETTPPGKDRADGKSTGAKKEKRRTDKRKSTKASRPASGEPTDLKGLMVSPKEAAKREQDTMDRLLAKLAEELGEIPDMPTGSIKSPKKTKTLPKTSSGKGHRSGDNESKSPAEPGTPRSHRERSSIKPSTSGDRDQKTKKHHSDKDKKVGGEGGRSKRTNSDKEKSKERKKRALEEQKTEPSEQKAEIDGQTVSVSEVTEQKVPSSPSSTLSSEPSEQKTVPSPIDSPPRVGSGGSVRGHKKAPNRSAKTIAGPVIKGEEEKKEKARVKSHGRSHSHGGDEKRALSRSHSDKK